LEEYFKKCGLYETDVDMQRRLEVLRKINTMVKKWVKNVSVDKVFFKFVGVICHLGMDIGLRK